MRIVCPHCSHLIEVSSPGTPREVPDHASGSTVAEGPRAAPERANPHQRLGKLTLLERVGAGSFGEVWKARDTELNRLVAVKIPRAGHLADGKDQDRFLREARSAAVLRHPGIVPVHEVGHEGGLSYLVCDFIEGLTLTDLLQARRLTFRETAEVIAQVAEALDYAHTHGVVHRDVKPSNIILERPGADPAAPPGRPLLMDFGLALRSDAEVTLTLEGQVLGTPAYMSPELAAGHGHQVDGRSDVYSAGVVLYQLLAGELPFRGNTRMLLDQVLHREPLPPRQLNDQVPNDLQTITLKCLAKEPSRRYRTADELAADLRRWLAGEPIHARPVGRAERLWRWCCCNPLPAGLSGTVAALLVVAVVGASVAAVWLGRAAGDADDARRKEEAARRAKELTLADTYVTQGVSALGRDDPALAVLWFAHAARLSGDDPERQRANRVRVRAALRAAPLPVHVFPHVGQEMTGLVFHPGGRHLLTLSRRHRCLVWDLDREQPVEWASGEKPVSAAAWAPDGTWLALGTPEGAVAIRGFPGGEHQHRLQVQGPVEALAVSPDGRFLALAGDRVRVWDTRTREFVTPELTHPRPVIALAFNGAGDRLATACLDGQARVFAVPGASASALFAPVPHEAEFPLAAVTPAILRTRVAPVFVTDGHGLLTRDARGAVTWRDAQTGKPSRPVPFTEGPVQAIAVAPDGKHFVVGGSGGARLWDAVAAGPVGAPLGNRNFTTAATFLPDGTSLLTVGGDRTAQLWSVPGGQALGPPLVHQSILTHAACSADSRLLATAQADGLVRVWARAGGNAGDHRMPLESGTTFARLSPDGRFTLSTGAGWRREGSPAAYVYEVATGRAAAPPLEGDGVLTDAALSPDGRAAATLHSAASSDEQRFSRLVEPEGRAGCLQLWDWREGRRRFAALPMPSEPRGVTFSPDGKRVVVICGGGQLRVIDPTTGKVMMGLEHGFERSSSNTYPGVRFTPDGQSLVSWGPDGAVKVWSSSTGKLRYAPLLHGGLVQGAMPSADGRRLVTASRDATARVWELDTGKPASEPLRHPDWVFTARFSLDGQQVLTASRDGSARLWDWRSGRTLCPPLKHADEVFAAALTPDGRFVLTTGKDQTARLWEWHTGKPVAPPLALGGWGWSALVTPDGRHAVVAGGAPALWAFDLTDLAEPAGLDADELCRLGEVLSGQRLHEGSDVAALTTDEWLQRWRPLHESHPRSALLGLSDAAAWHRRQGEAFAAARRWPAATWHLDRLIAAGPQPWQPYLDRARASIALGRWDRAAEDITRAIDGGAGGWKVWLDRGQAHAALRRWDQAAADYVQAVALGASSDRVLSAHAVLRLGIGDEKGYRRTCADMLGRFGKTENPKIANNVAWVCSYAPDAVPDLTPAIELAAKVARSHPRKYATLNTEGAILFRAGRCADAVVRLNAACKEHPRGGGPFDHLLLALAHHHLEQADEARDCLKEGLRLAELAEGGKLDDPTLPMPLFWIQRLELQILRREAERVINAR
jgi:WD40 repeat protein/tRNA A-37 threonylcarbamoyl transferase component Bud32/Flp pilus assembly protein TadD